jgi:F-type H+-transporting ATPase subunit gamma
MKMVAAARLRRAQDSIIQARPYARKMLELLRHLSANVNVVTYPHFAQRPVTTIGIVVVTADRGLCGTFNSNIIRTTAAHIEKKYATLNKEQRVRLYCIGRKGADFFSKRAYTVAGKYIGVFHSLSYGNAQTIAHELVDEYLGGKLDRIEVVYNEFKNAVQQRVIIEQYLPIPPESIDPHAGKKLRSLIDYIYEPSSDQIIGSLLPKHLVFQLWRILLESNAAEQGARMAAMENATTNAKEMIRVLELSYNKARQASITKELLEIVSGAEALKRAG